MTAPGSTPHTHGGGSTARELERRGAGSVLTCYQCGKCSAGCPMASETRLRPHDVMRLVALDRLDDLLADESIWLCLTCETCTARCPNSCDPARVIVAEVREEGSRKLVGVGRLIADPDFETAEYAILVADAFQNRGLGGVLTDYCLDVARKWGARRVVAETTSDNVRMVTLFAKRGFDLTTDEHGAVTVSKDLEPS